MDEDGSEKTDDESDAKSVSRSLRALEPISENSQSQQTSGEPVSETELQMAKNSSQSHSKYDAHKSLTLTTNNLMEVGSRRNSRVT